jgi:ATP-dependent Lon protease
MTLAMDLNGRVRQIFSDTMVFKSPSRNKSLQALGIPSFLRDWLIMRFADAQGQLDIDEVVAYVDRHIPRREQWEAVKGSLVTDGARAKILAKLRVEVDVRSGEGLFELPDFGFPSRKYEAIIEDKTLREHKETLLSNSESWGVVELSWNTGKIAGRPMEGRLYLTDFKPFRPYSVDVDFYREARKEFTLDEWIDILVMAIDYNPGGFQALDDKLALIKRLLPFVEKRLNLIELAPKGTGKSYVFSQISKYGWLVSGGNISRARMFYDISRRAPGLVSRSDYVALDEIQSIAFTDEEEMRGALKGYLESGEYRVGDYRGVGEAGMVLLGNIDEAQMDESKNMFRELPSIFHESALLDRFHGFLRGWEIPRMKESMKAEGWGLNVEYFSEILHSLRSDIRYRAVIDQVLEIPKGSDTRDTEAVKRIATALVKLLFPHWTKAEELDRDQFNDQCLAPAMAMRTIIRKQLHIMDREYRDIMPDIRCSG